VGFFGFFRKKSLDEHLSQTKTVNISGVDFEIRKITVLDYLYGATVLTENYSVWKKGSEIEQAKVAENNLKKHYRDVFLQCVISPVLKRKEEDSGPGEIFVDRLFLDWNMAHSLYMEIMLFTHGKKKLKKVLSR